MHHRQRWPDARTVTARVVGAYWTEALGSYQPFGVIRQGGFRSEMEPGLGQRLSTDEVDDRRRAGVTRAFVQLGFILA